MALPEERKAALLAYCRIDELSPEEETLFEAMYDAAVNYMTQAGVSEPEEGTPRRAQYDLCVNYLVLDSWDRRDVSIVGTSYIENGAFRRLLNQLKLTEPEGPPQNPQILRGEEEQGSAVERTLRRRGHICFRRGVTGHAHHRKRPEGPHPGPAAGL